MRELSDFEGFHPRDLTGRQRLILVYGTGLIALIVSFTVLYLRGMRTLENRPRSVFQAINTVIATMTTTGYGADAPWTSPAMNLFVSVMQVSGVVVGFVTLRVLIIPLFERTPLKLDDRLSVKDDHVVIAGYERDTEELLNELEALDVGYVLIEDDEEEAKRLSDDGYQAINGDPEERRDLDRASIGEAALLITDAGDRTASVVLTALEANEELRVLSFTTSTRRRAALAEIGVDRSVPPHVLIGQRLAEKATTPVTIETQSSGDNIAIREILVRRGSPLHGVRVGESPLANHPDLTLVAGWFDGELRLQPSQDERLTPNSVLVVAGPEQSIDEVASEVAGVRRPRDSVHSRIAIAGLGEGGVAARDALPDDAQVTTIDQSPDAGADVVGDVTEPETLRAADLEEASALVVTVDDDATALLTIAMARSLAPDVEVLARVTDTEKATAAFRAGADYVLSIQRVCARLAAAEAHGERVMDPVNQIRLVRTNAAPFAGRSLSAVRADSGHGWTVVGIARDGRTHTGPTTEIASEDDVFVAGSDAAIQEFEQTVGSE
ncbi:potassium channel family protein [Haloarcula nitratireducens]|uniref:NAD-binding protein n=1 Tax=Haloarcula nitratireducens TaxID=2487749 RepID=A0AAW4PAI9_9EURY|nr:NAD-binding protein [Halomicroarcula nitratireducens]MBX0294977.1 NAD-binding protein [Halomicroarcula nitratireducens]